MRVIFQGNNKPFSLLIRLFTFGRWHHCGALVGDLVYEARGSVGVVITPLSEFKSRGEWAIMDIPEVGVNQKWLDSQVGKKYDWGAIFGLVLRNRNWQREDKWYCPELVSVLATKSGYKLVNDTLRGITPKDLWVLPHKVVEYGYK